MASGPPKNSIWGWHLNNVGLEMKGLFEPSSVAIVGASRKPGKVGHEVLKNVIQSEYRGPIYPVNPSATEILGLRCYPSVSSLPETPDLAVIVIPALQVPDVVDECGQVGVKVVVVISAGFKESGPEGSSLERRLVEICRKHGIRLVGPNCLGVIDTYTPLNASFSAGMPPKGNVALVSQSGALLTAVLDWSLTQQFGFSKVLSLGNKADVDEVDLLHTLGGDTATRAIFLYVEGIERGRRFVQAAETVARRKPVVVLKSGTSEAGSRAVSSHTGALAGSEAAYATAFKQAGVMRVTSLEQLFILAEAFSELSPPEVEGTVILTNAGGPGILATDACEKHGVELARIEASTANTLRSFLPPAASLYNPVDVLGDARADRYSRALETVLKQETIGSAIVILTPQAMTEPKKTASEITDLRTRFSFKPITVVAMGGPAVRGAKEMLSRVGVPCYDYPEHAVMALSGLIEYKRILGRFRGEKVERLAVDVDEAKRIVEGARNEGRVSLLGNEAKALMRAYGIPVPRSYLATTPSEAADMAERIGFPVVLKVSSPEILHKTDVGGVRLGLSSASQVRRVFREVIQSSERLAPGAKIHGVEVYGMSPPGREVIVGLTRDSQFGPLLMFGAGGIYADFIRDVSFRLPPVSPRSAHEMMQETKVYTLLRGVRGEKQSDLDSVVDVIARVSQLAVDLEEEILDVDINPLFVYERGKGSIAVDVKVALAR